MPRKAWLIRLPSGTDAGSRTDFWGKNRAIFSGELFSGEEFLPRTAFSGKKCRSILSNQVISWNGSRADRCCQNVFSSWGLSSFGLNQNFLFVEKKKTQMEVRDLWIHSTANYREQSCRQVMLLPKFLSRKKLSIKYRSIFEAKISPATGVRFVPTFFIFMSSNYVLARTLAERVVCCFESRVWIENWKWVSKGCGSYLIHPGKPLAFPPL